MPFMHHLCASRSVASGTHGERDAAVAEFHDRLGLFVSHRKQISSPPQVMALPLDKLTRRLPRLSSESRLLITNPSELRQDIGTHHFCPRPLRRDKRHTSV